MNKKIILVILLILFLCTACIVICGVSFIILRDQAIKDFEYSLDNQQFPIYSDYVTIDNVKVELKSQATHPLFGEPTHTLTITNTASGKSKDIIYTNPNFRNLRVYSIFERSGNKYIGIMFNSANIKLINTDTLLESNAIYGDGLLFDESRIQISTKRIKCIETNGVKKYYSEWPKFSNQYKEAVAMDLISITYIGEFNWENGITKLEFLNDEEKTETEVTDQLYDIFFACGEDF